MIKKLFDFIKYTGNLFLLFKIPFSWLLNKLGFFKIATKIMCKKPYILWTPFGNYLATTLFHYFCIIENYEPKIRKQIDNISRNIKGEESYLINIGANIGRYSIGLAKQYGYNVLAFEPGPSTFKNLKINTLLSDLEDKTQLFNIGLGNSNENMVFSMSTECDACAHVIADNNTTHYDTMQIPIKRFDDLGIDEKIIAKTKLIIIDVEGFELNVIKGMEKSLKKMKNINVIMEIWNYNKEKENTINYMKDLGYAVTAIDEDNYLFTK